jgi:hypothetical protein
MVKGFFVTQSLGLGGLGLVLLGLAVACEQGSEKNGASSGGTSASSGGTSGTGGGSDGNGGSPEEEAIRKGERGSSCNSSSDCEDGLSCIVTNDCPAGVACSNKSCQPSNFEIMGTGKQCHIVDCATTADCCGDLPLKAPAKCLGRERICSQPTLPGCTTITCTSDAQCGPGTCRGTCSLDGELCLTLNDCQPNTCNTSENSNTCEVTGADCTDFTCTTNTCSSPYCRCQNPDYDPTDPICTDPDCEKICGFVCENERCVVDTGCDVDDDCPASTPFCDQRVCVECLTSDDCDDEQCTNGRCGPECEVSTQCAKFEACMANECVYVGCQSDRECVLSASNRDPAKDPRLAKCRIENGIGTCVYPCEIDAQCAPTEVCLGGICEYIGCETDSECKTIAGLHNQPLPTELRPWVTTAECRADP